MTLVEMSFMVFCAVGSITAGLAYVLRNRPVDYRGADQEPSALHFLFHDLELEHASDGAESFVGNNGLLTDWGVLHARLLPCFPELPNEENLLKAESQTLHATHTDDQGIIQLDREGMMTRLVIRDEHNSSVETSHLIRTMGAELDILRLASVGAPYPIWLTDTQGKATWSNQAYESLLNKTKAARTNEDQALFETNHLDIQPGQTVRLSVPDYSQNAREWFNVTANDARGGTIFHAVNIDAVIQAELAQRNFVQTLAKTFAQLSIGLAIFDRNGHLALFNPALVDLSFLPPEFLSARPDLLSFFDKLRDNRVMPEPKNYLSWRQEISNVISDYAT